MNKYNINGLEILSAEEPLLEGNIVKCKGVLVTDLEMMDLTEESPNLEQHVSMMELTFAEKPVMTRITVSVVQS